MFADIFRLKKEFPEIDKINDTLFSKGISALVISIRIPREILKEIGSEFLQRILLME